MQGPHFISLSSRRAHKALPLRTQGPSSRGRRARLRCHSSTGNAAALPWNQVGSFLQEKGPLIAFIGGASINLYKLNDLEVELKEMKKNYATKDDLKEMRMEMKTHATKDDLKEMKTEMKTHATKDDLEKLRSDQQKDFQLFYTSAENAQLKERLAELSSKKQ